MGHTVILRESLAIIVVGTQGSRDAEPPQRVLRNGWPARSCAFVTYGEGGVDPLQNLGAANRHVGIGRFTTHDESGETVAKSKEILHGGEFRRKSRALVRGVHRVPKV